MTGGSRWFISGEWIGFFAPLRLGALVLRGGAGGGAAIQRKARQDAKAQRRHRTVRSAGKSG